MKLSAILMISFISLYGSLGYSCPTEAQVQDSVGAKIIEWLHAHNWAGKENKVYFFAKEDWGEAKGLYPVQLTIDGQFISTAFLPKFSSPDQNGCTDVVSVERHGTVGR
jgi:hypothetical protein